MSGAAKIAVLGPSEKIPTQPSDDPFVHVIERMVRDPSVDLVRLKEAMGMVQGMRDQAEEREAEAAFNAAMADVQAKMTRVAADAKNDQTKSKYATYAALDRALKPLYTAAGFALSFNEEVGAVGPDMVRIVCYVTHTAKTQGHIAKRSFTRTYHIDMPADGKGAKGGDVMTKTHAHGSATTYGRRYLLSMIFNIAIGNDDDGNAAANTVITADQAELLTTIAREVGADLSKTCSHFGIASIELLPSAKYASVKAGLEAKRAPL